MRTFFEDMTEAVESVTKQWMTNGRALTVEDMHGLCSMFLMQAATCAVGHVQRKDFMCVARKAYSEAEKTVRDRSRREHKEQRALGRGLLNSILGGPIDPDIDPSLNEGSEDK